MKGRLAAGGLAGGVALALSGPTFAAFTPRLIVDHSPLQLSASGPTDITYTSGRNDDASGRVVFYVPQGYQGVYGAAPDTQMGTVNGKLQATAISPDPIPISGTIVTDDPAKYIYAAIACTGTPTHQAVWLLQLAGAGQMLDVPVYIDSPPPAPDASFAQAKQTVCFPPPEPLGVKLLELNLAVKPGVFVFPGTVGAYTWRAIATPWGSGGALNPAGTVEARGIVRIPVQVTLTSKRVTVKAKLSGAFKAGGQAVGGAAVTLLAGRASTKLKPIGKTTTSSAGMFSKSVAVAAGMFVQARATTPQRDVTATECAKRDRSLSRACQRPAVRLSRSAVC
jgi:hypothetical protein